MNIWKTLPHSKEHLSVLHFECTNFAIQATKETGITMSDEVIGFATETAYRFCQVFATDVESFAKHANRHTINLDDIRLFCRRNPYLRTYVDGKVAEMKASASVSEPGNKLASDTVSLRKKKYKRSTLPKVDRLETKNSGNYSMELSSPSVFKTSALNSESALPDSSTLQPRTPRKTSSCDENFDSCPKTDPVSPTAAFQTTGDSLIDTPMVGVSLLDDIDDWFDERDDTL